jgi:MoxR-like ATPase
VAEYAISTNLISWVPAHAEKSIFGWPQDGAEGEAVESMGPGDLLIPKFAQNPDYRRHGSQADYVRGICEVLELDYEEQLAAYQQVVAGGAGAVPFIWRVTKNLGDDDGFPSGEPWATVAIEVEKLEHPISTSEFLRLRVIPIDVARQFKATAATGRHVQALPDGTASAVRGAGKSETRGPEALRRLSLVKAASPEEGAEFLASADRGPDSGDLAYLVTEENMPGLYEAGSSGALAQRPEGEFVARRPGGLLDLFERAIERKVPSDGFTNWNALRSGEDLAAFMASDELVHDLGEFTHFYDRFVILPRRVSLALEIAARPAPPEPPPPVIEPEDEEDEPEQVELESLHGLTASSVEAQLGDVKLPKRVLAEAVTAIRSGKHLLLSGPPGTGKSRLATALCRAVVSDSFDMATATADWTTFDTIGGYIPRAGGALDFEPGIVLRALQRGNWLIIDELNRADIDKAFGPLFTLLSGSGDLDGAGQDVVLPFKRAEKNVRIVWAERREDASSPYALTPVWRLVGTLNVRDKATLFQLGFAFLRRFAVVDVPLPAEDAYRQLFAGWLDKVEGDEREKILEAAMKLAFGPRQLGPAILKDIGRFTSMGRTETETSEEGAPYGDSVDAFLTAVSDLGAGGSNSEQAVNAGRENAGTAR